MGYSTKYNLSIIQGNTDLLEEFVESSSQASYAIDSNGDCNQECKWYNHEDELKEFSLKYPLLVLELKGEGEESGDIWVKYFHNGKVQTSKAKITFDSFDLNKLK